MRNALYRKAFWSVNDKDGQNKQQLWFMVAGVSRFWSGSSAACSLLCLRLRRRGEVSTDPHGMRAGPQTFGKSRDTDFIL